MDSSDNILAEVRVLDNRVDHVEAEQLRQCGRLAELEKATWRMSGLVAIAAALFAAIGSIGAAYFMRGN